MMMTRTCMTMMAAIALLMITVHAAAQDVAPTAPGVVADADGRAYRIYVEAMPGETWDDKIDAAVYLAMESWSGAEIILPGRTIELTRPIRLWRRRHFQVGGETIDTRADNIELAYLGNCYTSIKGGTPRDLPRGITLRGTSRGATVLQWKGGANQVVIDMPAPWYCNVSDLTIDGNNADGLIGIRYRAGWEFGVNGGKHNVFENITVTRVDVGIDVGGPFLPDLVDGSFRMIRVEAARIGIRVVGANVAEMWFHEISIGTCQESGFKLGGYSGRLIRSIDEKDTPTDEVVLTDDDGREIFFEQIEHMEQLMQQQVQTRPHPDVPGSEGRKWVGGGAASCFISNVEAHMHDPRAWLIDSWYAPVRMQFVRMEGSTPVLRAGPRGAFNGRFNDILIDVNAVSTGGVGGHVIEYDRRNSLTMIGGTFDGTVALGNAAQCYVMGTRFMESTGKTRPGVIPQDAELPQGSFFSRTGETMKIHYRGGLIGDRVISGPQPEPRIVQLRGTSGAKVYRMPEGDPPPAE